MSDKDQLAESRTDLAEDRTVLANERTLGSWLRTVFAPIGIGLAFNALFQRMEPAWLPRGIATAFLLIAIAIFTAPLVALAESLGVSPRPFLVAVMIAGSAAFATPFGYQTNVLVYQMGGYSYMDFVKVGLPLNLVTWIAAAIAIPMYFPF